MKNSIYHAHQAHPCFYCFQPLQKNQKKKKYLMCRFYKQEWLSEKKNVKPQGPHEIPALCLLLCILKLKIKPNL